MLSLASERDIQAPVGAVWRALTDFPRYPKWTGAAVLAEDPDRPSGMTYAIRVRTGARPEQTWKLAGRFVAREASHRIAWRCGVAFALGLEMAFELASRGGHTQVRHVATFRGLAPLLRPALVRGIFQPVLDALLRDLDAEARRRQRRGA